VVRPAASGGDPTDDKVFTGGFLIPRRTCLATAWARASTEGEGRRWGGDSPAATSGTTVVVDGKVREELGSVLYNEGCIWSMPRHEKEDKLSRSVGSPKWGGGHR
jgi:hypothetical protein